MMPIQDERLIDACVPVELFSHLQRKLAEIDPSELKRQVAECLKFLFIASRAPCGWLPVSQEIDKIWHEWILETRQYERLCAEHLGRFIHHSGNIALEMPEQEERELLKRDLYLVAVYVANFGCFHQECVRYWPVVTHLLRCLEVSLEQLCSTAEKIAATSQQLPYFDVGQCIGS